MDGWVGLGKLFKYKIGRHLIIKFSPLKGNVLSNHKDIIIDKQKGEREREDGLPELCFIQI